MKNLIESIRQMYQPQNEATMMKDDGKMVHNCAKHVEHAEYGRGNCISEEHAAPDRNGNIAWYDIMFEHGVERGVPTSELKILQSENHMHSSKKSKKMAEGNDGNLANNAPPYDKVTRGDVIAGRLGKDEMGGKKKKPAVKEEAGGIPEKPTGGSNAATPEDHNRPIKKKAMDAAMAAANKTATGPLATAPVVKQGMTKEDADFEAEMAALNLTEAEIADIQEAYMGMKKLTGELKAKGATNAPGLAAWIGRKKYGKEKFQKAAAAGKKLGEDIEQVDELMQVYHSTSPGAQMKRYAKDSPAPEAKAHRDATAAAVKGLRASGALNRKSLSHGSSNDIKTKKGGTVWASKTESVEVDEEIHYKTSDYDISEVSTDYDSYFQALLQIEGVKLTDLDQEETLQFIECVDEIYATNDVDVFLEAYMASDLADIKAAHRKAGNKISDEKSGSKGGEAHHSFVVTQPSGKRTRHIYHGKTKKLETMSAAPRSKEAKETGEDDDDK